MKRKGWSPSTSSMVCTEHFAQEDVNETYPSVPRLRENVISTIFPAYPSYYQKAVDKKRKLPHPRDGSNKRQKLCSASTSEEHDNESLSQNIGETETSGENVAVESPSQGTPNEQPCTSKHDEVNFGARTQLVEQDNIEFLKRKVKDMEEKLQSKCRIIKRLRNHTYKLKSRIKDLKI